MKVASVEAQISWQQFDSIFSHFRKIEEVATKILYELRSGTKKIDELTHTR